MACAAITPRNRRSAVDLTDASRGTNPASWTPGLRMKHAAFGVMTGFLKSVILSLKVASINEPIKSRQAIKRRPRGVWRW
jgi:hypothetical protein